MKKLFILFAFVSCNQVDKVQEKKDAVPKKEHSVIINMDNSNGNNISVTQDDTTIMISDSVH